MKNNDSINIIGCGYIGKQLAQKLAKQAIDVNAYVSSDSSQAECLTLNIACEIMNLDVALLPLEQSNSRSIYLAPPPKSGQIDTRIRHFLQAIEKQPPEKFVYISTTGVYGDCHGDWIDETNALKPKADRAFRRADAEQQVQQFCDKHAIPLVILRVAGIYGPGKIPIARIKSGQAIVSQQDSPYTNRIHAHDLVSICEKALLSDSITGTYNVTDGNPSTMYDYFTGLAKALDLPKPPAISLEQAKQELSQGMLSYMAESRRISNEKLLRDFEMSLSYPTLQQGVEQIAKQIKG